MDYNSVHTLQLILDSCSPVGKPLPPHHTNPVLKVQKRENIQVCLKLLKQLGILNPSILVEGKVQKNKFQTKILHVHYSVPPTCCVFWPTIKKCRVDNYSLLNHNAWLHRSFALSCSILVHVSLINLNQKRFRLHFHSPHPTFSTITHPLSSILCYCAIFLWLLVSVTHLVCTL